MPKKRIIRAFLDFPLRRKLVLSFLAVISIGGLLILVIGTRLEHRAIFSLAQTKVRHDLASAWMVYNEKANNIRDVIRLSAAREFIRDAFRTGRPDGLERKLAGIREDFKLDILTLVDERGRVVLRTRRPEARGDDQSGDPLVRRALRGETVSATQIVPRAEMLKEGPDLAERASLSFIPTPMAADRPEDHEENGIMLKAASPVIEDGRILGVLYGGVLFNRNYDLVDQVKDIVFKGEKYRGKDIGTATIFQGDLRIATNVFDTLGERAIGTRVSREVNQAVLRDGGHWVGRAFVVNEWYISAYEPIGDIDGRIIGMLYVGMLEKPYVDLRNKLMGTFAVLAGLCALFLLALLSFIAKSITHPLRDMALAADKIARQDLNHRVMIDSKDEIGRLAGAFNRMTEDLQKANESLTQWGQMLEKRVDERTRELRETQDALIQSAKLGSLGKMAAGVAHEINNPLTSILINTHLLLESAPPEYPYRENLILIAEETSRCAGIVKGLLEFSRQTPSLTASADVNTIIERAVQMFEMQASVRNIRIVKNLDESLPAIELDTNKMQQVVSNLILNACEAMPEGGVLKISSRLGGDGSRVEIVVADTGSGIPKENVPKIFDPFFTTKSFGTGLGLAVSYGIVRRFDGEIDVESEVGHGSVFIVKLPLVPQAEEKSDEENRP